MDASAPVHKGWNARAAAMQAKLSSLGLAGVLAYGLLNTIYYTAAFFTLWVYVVKVPRGEHIQRMGWDRKFSGVILSHNAG